MERISFDDCRHYIAQGAINIDDGLTNVEKDSRVHRAMHDLCFWMTQVEKSIPVTCVTVTDPDSKAPVEVEIRKLVESGAMVGIDASYLASDVDEIRNPYNPGTIEVPDDET